MHVPHLFLQGSHRGSLRRATAWCCPVRCSLPVGLASAAISIAYCGFCFAGHCCFTLRRKAGDTHEILTRDIWSVSFYPHLHTSRNDGHVLEPSLLRSFQSVFRLIFTLHIKILLRAIRRPLWRCFLSLRDCQVNAQWFLRHNHNDTWFKSGVITVSVSDWLFKWPPARPSEFSNPRALFKCQLEWLIDEWRVP